METPDTFINISFTLQGAVALGWLVVAILYTVFSFILVYHWRAYATNAAVVRLTLIWYFVSTGLCLALAVVLILFI